MERIKYRVYKIIEKAEENDFSSLLFDYFIVALILLNVLAIVLQSYTEIYVRYKYVFRDFEIFSVMIFTLEYILRIWTANNKFKEKDEFESAVLFIITPMALVDLIAILPFYLPMLIPFDLRFLRIFRFFRLFKLSRYSNSLHIMGNVLRKKKNELMITIFITFILLLVASTLMYYLEHRLQPDAFPNIIVSFWWAISTLTTVGYGDVYPVTAWGRFLSGVIAFLGIGLVALPTGLISSGFVEELNSDDSEIDSEKEYCRKYCPYCGKKLEDD